MTRKHFNALAEIVSRFKGSHIQEKLANDLADFCAEQNSFFDREKFLTACGV